MFGLSDFWIWSAYLLCLLSSLLCVVYGALMWNKGAEVETPTEEDVRWAEEEEKIGEEL